MNDNKKFQIRTCGLSFIDNKLLLIAHNKNNKIYWVVPGGRCEFGEPAVKTIEREFLEELNLKVKVVKFLFYNESLPPEYPYHNLNLFFLLKPLNDKIRLGDDPILHSYKLFTQEELREIDFFPNVKDKVIKNFEKWLEESL